LRLRGPSTAQKRQRLLATETLPPRTDAAGLRQAVAFTEVFRRHEAAPPARREAACLAAQFPAILLPIQDGDLFAGRLQHAPVGFSPEPGGLGYYCDAAALRAAAREAVDEGDAAARDAAQETTDFWRGRTTRERVRAA
jgi:hypothetical protein